MTTSHREPPTAAFTRAWPRLGDLVLDTARRDGVGVIVGVPYGDSASITFHLRSADNGPPWSAPADASTLRPVPSPVTHATLCEGPGHHRAGGHWALRVRLHHQDGSEQDCVLALSGEQARNFGAAVRDEMDLGRVVHGDIFDAVTVLALMRDVPLTDVPATTVSTLAPSSAPTAFFAWLASTLPITSATCLVISHLLPGQMDFLGALSQTTKIAAVLPKPKSANDDVVQQTAADFPCDELDRGRFADPDWLTGYIRQRSEGRRVVLSDVGGYFAPALAEVCARLPGQIAGVVEDTENGHRRYEALPELPCAVYSAARSPLKEPEDRLVGEAVVFSVETLLRHLGEVFQGRQACVLGYGKIGAGIAAALHARHVRVTVLDVDPVRQAQALSVGYGCGDLIDALGSADLVFSATGSRALARKHLPLLREGAFLAGATSRDDEFDLGDLTGDASDWDRTEIIPGVSRIGSRQGRSFFLLGNGNAVNFLHTSAMGSAIHLVKAEMTVAAAALAEIPHEPGFYEVAASRRASIAAAWVGFFGSRPGRYL